MKAIILAAGYGTRLKELTDQTPKPMIELGGKPLIGHIIDRLSLHGIRDLLIHTHYLHQNISDYIQGRALYFYDPPLLSHEETVRTLKSWLKGEDFFVINGDTWTDLDYTSMYTFHKNQKSITAYMDEWRCAGTWIYPANYFQTPNISVVPYRPVNTRWFDIGTKKGLKSLKGFFKHEKKSH